MIDDANLAARLRAKTLPIVVLGMGHVGLPTALGLAELGWNVTGADDDAAKVSILEAGTLPFYEPGWETRSIAWLARGWVEYKDEIHAFR